MVEGQNNFEAFGEEVSQYLLAHIIAIKQHILVMTHQKSLSLTCLAFIALCPEGTA